MPSPYADQKFFNLKRLHIDIFERRELIMVPVPNLISNLNVYVLFLFYW